MSWCINTARGVEVLGQDGIDVMENAIGYIMYSRHVDFLPTT